MLNEPSSTIQRIYEKRYQRRKKKWSNENICRCTLTVHKHIENYLLRDSIRNLIFDYNATQCVNHYQKRIKGGAQKMALL